MLLRRLRKELLCHSQRLFGRALLRVVGRLGDGRVADDESRRVLDGSVSTVGPEVQREGLLEGLFFESDLRDEVCVLGLRLGGLGLYLDVEVVGRLDVLAEVEVVLGEQRLLSGGPSRSRS